MEAKPSVCPQNPAAPLSPERGAPSFSLCPGCQETQTKPRVQGRAPPSTEVLPSPLPLWPHRGLGLPGLPALPWGSLCACWAGLVHQLLLAPWSSRIHPTEEQGEGQISKTRAGESQRDPHPTPIPASTHPPLTAGRPLAPLGQNGPARGSQGGDRTFLPCNVDIVAPAQRGRTPRVAPHALP